MRYEYTEAVREGVRTILRLAPGGAARDAFASLALTPYRDSGKRLRRWPTVFSFSSPSGIWRGGNFTGGRGTTRGITACRLYPFTGRSYFMRNRPSAERSEGEEQAKTEDSQRAHPHRGWAAIPSIAKHTQLGAPVPANSYPVGKRLRAVEFEAPRQPCARGDLDGGALFCNFNSTSGRSARGGECPFGLHRRMKQSGIRWAIRAQVARRLDFKGTKLRSAAEIDGFAQPLRRTEKKTTHPNVSTLLIVNSMGG